MRLSGWLADLFLRLNNFGCRRRTRHRRSITPEFAWTQIESFERRRLLSGSALVTNLQTPTVTVNHAPSGTSHTVTTGVNVPYVIKIADFGFTDPNDSPPNGLLAVKFPLLPSAGTLKDNGIAVTANQFVPVADVNLGKLVFTPNANLTGGPFFLCKFQVQDNGGTANGGTNLDPVTKVLYVNIVKVNHAPAGTAKTVTTLEDMPYVVKAVDFGFTDPNDNPANTLKTVKLTLLPAAGTLRDNGVAVTTNQSISAADINNGKLVFAPNANLNGSGLFLCKFQLQDTGGTAFGGVDLDPVPKVLKINLTSVNDAPTGTPNTVSTAQNTAYVFKTADFGFADPKDSPANGLLAVKITTLPVKGQLIDNGVAVTTGLRVVAADITAGKFKFVPAANALASPYSTFQFQVQDNGGTGNGGIDLDPTSRSLTVNVTSGLVGGPEMQINSYTTGRQLRPAVAMDSAGDFVTVWISDFQDGSNTGIFARRYSAAGTAEGSEFKVNTYTAGFQVNPAVAMDSNGNFVITWQSDGQDGGGIYAQRYNALGAPQGSEFKVNSSPNRGQNNPEIAMDAAGDFAITWNSYGQDGSGNGVYARRYGASGAAQGAEFLVNIYTTGSQDAPTIAMDHNGDFVIAWTGLGPDSSTNNGIYLQRYGTAGNPTGSQFHINTSTTINQQSPSVAMDATGDFVVTWYNANQDGSGNGVFAQRFSSAGTSNGAIFQVNTYTTNNQSEPSVSMDANGDFVVTWRSNDQGGSGYGIYAQRYDAAGSARGTEFQVSAHLTPGQSFPHVAMDADGSDFVAVWASYGQDGSSYGVYARRFTQT